MNEQLRELWEEATGSTWPHPGKFTAGEYDYQLEKFAEMIIQECLGIVNRHEYSYHEADPLWETAQLIKQRFGIEE